MQIQLSGLLLKFRTKNGHPFLIQSPHTNFNVSSTTKAKFNTAKQPRSERLKSQFSKPWFE